MRNKFYVAFVDKDLAILAEFYDDDLSSDDYKHLYDYLNDTQTSQSNFYFDVVPSYIFASIEHKKGKIDVTYKSQYSKRYGKLDWAVDFESVYDSEKDAYEAFCRELKVKTVNQGIIKKLFEVI